MATQVVSPGEFLISKDTSTIIETSLGSCVGVALYDPLARMGAMLHVLLPAGGHDKESLTPARFARSAVPFILSQMVDAGASRQRICATVAGGALVAADKPLSVEMNIGRRNSVAILDLLDRQAIPVVKRDIGGRIPRVLRLVVADGRTSIEKIGQRLKDQPAPSAQSSIENRDLELKIDKLKPLPQVARRILMEVNRPDFSFMDLEQEILKDQALTANVLKVCNSALYGYSRSISSVRRALDLIGVKGLLEIVLAGFAHGFYSRNVAGYSIKKGQLMQHSVCCGLVAELIAFERRICDSALALTAGLLHDIGKVILDQYAFEKFNLIMDKVMNEKRDFLDAESEILGFNHAQVGGLVARQWNLPEALIEAISLHHEPQLFKVDPRIVSAVHLADKITSMFGNVCSVDAFSNPVHRFAVETLELRRGDVERIILKLPEIVRRLESICTC